MIAPSRLRSAAHIAGLLLATAVCGVLVIPLFLGWTPIIVAGGSMEPAIRYGSLAFVSPVSASEIQVADIITFRKQGTLVSHRVVAHAQPPPGFITRGDANTANDIDVVAPRQVLGRNELHLPYVGLAVATLRTPIGFAFAIALPAGWLICNRLFAIAELVRESRHRGSV